MHALFDAEASHEWAVKMLPLLRIRDKGKDADSLAFEWKGLRFDNPIGLSAGFDKHAEAVDALFQLGFGYVEIGSVTPEPQVSFCCEEGSYGLPFKYGLQEGNPKPRMFRLPNTRSVINRYGFNSQGHQNVVERLRSRIQDFYRTRSDLIPPSFFPLLPPGSDITQHDPLVLGLTPSGVDLLGLPQSLRQGQVLAINLGKNKISAPDSIEDYVNGVRQLGPYADVLVVNVSSPNTPGLRSLQKKEVLSSLLQSVREARDQLQRKPPLLVKIAPDLNEFELEDIAHSATASKIDGIIVSNTTIQRPESAGHDLSINEIGGLSGPPLKPLALTALSTLYRMTRGKMTLIGCGGISTAQDVLDYGRAGATFVQLYTSLGYEGPGLPRQLKDDLAARLAEEGKTWPQIVGTGARLPTQREWEREARVRKDKAEQHSRVQFEQGLLDLRKEIEKALAHPIEKLRDVKREVEEVGYAPILIQESGVSNVVASQGVTAHSTVASGSEPQSGMLEISPNTSTSSGQHNQAESSTNTKKGGGLFSTFGSRKHADQYTRKMV